MKTYCKTMFKYLGIFVLIIIFSTSCTKYLDKAPDAEISEQDIFKKFITFQGFMEDIYQNVVDETIGKSYREYNFNWADELAHNWRGTMVENFDLGNYLFIWTGGNYTPYPGTNSGNNDRGRGYWDNGWHGIRQCNLALAHLDDMVGATQEQRDIIEGQAYFFRAYFHFELMRNFGGLAYIDTVFTPSDELRLTRLSYKEMAAKATADLQKAAQLLPKSWDETAVGQATLGSNQGRIVKGPAYGYLGKNLLYAASPLMNGMETGNYVYNEELCKEAAAAFLEVIKLADQGYYGLETWENYKNIFYTLNGNVPLGKEIIFNNPIYMSKRNLEGDWLSPNIGGGSGDYASPTQNYVENFGMANGLPLNEPDSGYDPANPWVNRDPRFYYNIIIDGERIIKNTVNADTYAQFYTGGRHRNSSYCITGYGQKKYHDITCNKYDNGWSSQFYWECAQMRLADVYLMYAEAVNEAYGPNGSSPGGISATQAVNIVRNRAGVPNVDNRFLTKEKFREIIRQERAVELAFETHRWFDLRRWHVAHELKYRERYVLDFPKDHSFFTRRLYSTRIFEDKHYWLPLPVKSVTLYPGFYQNPGW